MTDAQGVPAESREANLGKPFADIVEFMVDGEVQRYPVLPLFLVALILILAAPVYWRTLEQPTAKRKERAYENVQLYQRVYPMMHYGFGRLREGALPLWNPRQLCGAPFLANPQSGLFQPLNWVFLLPNTGYALAAHAFMALALMAFGFVLFARSIGTGFTGALIGGMTYAFSGAVAAAVSRPELAGALAWTPFFFWALRECVADWRLAWACLAGVFAALTLLAGSLGLAAVMLGLGLAYGAVRLVPGVTAVGVTRGARAGRLVVIVLVGALLSLVQWLPSAAWALTLDKPWQVLWQIDIAGTVPHSLGELFAQMLTAPRGQLPAVGYLGIVAVAVLPAAYFARRSQVDAVYFTLAAIVLSLLALAGDVPRETPFAPVLFLYPAVFSVAVLAALGADRLLTTGRDPRSPLVWVPAVLSLAAGVVLFWAVPGPVKGILIVLGLVLLP
ncbi:MAG: hypothetical protein IT368_07765, partial [Candidatus Hydrogenedentes bacterium]|nr:hypothetical protein [Candidatus Hydrogenedentota bacterium]